MLEFLDKVFFNNRIYSAAVKLTCKIVEDKYDKVEVKPGLCRYNFRCHLNAVHDAIESGHEKIALCLYSGPDLDYPIIHFLNVYHDGTFVDNTLGHWSSKYEYRLVRYISKHEFFSVESIFSNFREELRSATGWMSRFTSFVC